MHTERTNDLPLNVTWERDLTREERFGFWLADLNEDWNKSITLALTWVLTLPVRWRFEVENAEQGWAYEEYLTKLAGGPGRAIEQSFEDDAGYVPPAPNAIGMWLGSRLDAFFDLSGLRELFSPCSWLGHDLIDDSYGGPDSGYMGVQCTRCSYNVGTTLY